MLTSPLRYPGGKAKLFPFFSAMLVDNELTGADYIEPYAGGAGLALRLLSEGFISSAVLNDSDPAIHAFWDSVLNNNDEFCESIHRVELTIAEWKRQRLVYSECDATKPFELGFAVFFLNRTSRSGILDGSGPIGGYEQSSLWKIDARFDKQKQLAIVSAVGRYRRQIELQCEDALPFLQRHLGQAGSITYLDPPYFVKGKKLYRNFYSTEDHQSIAQLLHSKRMANWVLSYDDVLPIRNMYPHSTPITYNLTYTASTATLGREIIYLSDALQCSVPKGLRLAA